MGQDSGWQKFVNKITDTINKDKWDRSCLNPALLSMASESEPVDVSNFQSQLDARKERLEQEQRMQESQEAALAEEVPDLQEETPAKEMSDLQEETPAEEVPDLQAEAPTEGMSDLQAEAPTEEVPDLQEETPTGEVPDLQEETPAEEVSDLQAGAKYCYYVKIIHESTFPKEGSVRIMRSCDREYVWTDSISETEIPTCTTCNRCGKPVGHTEVRME